MTAEVLTYMAANQSVEKRMQFELVVQCAPFLKGMRTASMLNIKRAWIQGLCRLLEPAEISVKILVAGEEKCLVMFYRRERLLRLLSAKEVRRFLMDYGYDGGGLDKDISRLSGRMELYSEEKITFPHEVGVFLDYPLEDVKAFIKNNGKGSIFTGYWKVYHNPYWAGLTFSAYDKARDSAVNEFLIGKNIDEIVRTW